MKQKYCTSAICARKHLQREQIFKSTWTRFTWALDVSNAHSQNFRKHLLKREICGGTQISFTRSRLDLQRSHEILSKSPSDQTLGNKHDQGVIYILQHHLNFIHTDQSLFFSNLVQGLINSSEFQMLLSK